MEHIPWIQTKAAGEMNGTSGALLDGSWFCGPGVSFVIARGFLSLLATLHNGPMCFSAWEKRPGIQPIPHYQGRGQGLVVLLPKPRPVDR